MTKNKVRANITQNIPLSADINIISNIRLMPGIYEVKDKDGNISTITINSEGKIV